ncbi:hypothetical protein AC579_7498 [Pseudocercospora musae]|uniref:Uncharacterized protein n=1 Tax=Pseudocercospora musae TaxID=113226 RepID=A0A139IBQ5_9PEZI|nr:hypothetical protein AC579_7498 [Pseudocercospora musae]
MPRGIIIDPNEVNQLTRNGGLSFFARAGYANSAHLDPIQAAIYIHAMQKNLVLQDYGMVRELHMMIHQNQQASKLLLARADIIRACTQDGSGEQYLSLASQNLFEAPNREETQDPSPELERLKACLSALSRSVQEFRKQKRSERSQIMKAEMGPEALMTDIHIRQMNLDQLQTAYKKLRDVSHMLATKLLHNQEQVAGGTNSRDLRMNNGSGPQGQGPLNALRMNVMPNGDITDRSVQVSNGNGAIGGATGPMSKGLPNGGAHDGNTQIAGVKRTYAQASGTVPGDLAKMAAQLSNVYSSDTEMTANGSPAFARNMVRMFWVTLHLKQEQLEGMSSANLVSTTMKLQQGLFMSLQQLYAIFV